MRPHQWHKNLLVFAALIFDVKFLQPTYLLRTIAAFAMLCLLSSSVYLFNDIADVEQDRQHPKKRFRPIAAGQLSIRTAWILALALPMVILPLSFWLNPYLGLVLLLYWGQNLAYSFKLKHVVIIDVLLVASGFLLRVVAGVQVIDVERFSPWLYLCVTLGSLLIGFGKRRHELMLIQNGSTGHRVVLDQYNLPFVDSLINMVATSTLLAYCLYTFSAPNLPQNHAMMLTIPFVIYGLARYLYLMHVRGEGGSPDELILRDKPLALTVLIWVCTAAFILYFWGNHAA